MDQKTFWKETKTGFILKNVLAAAVIVAVLLTGLQTGLKKYTQHGTEVEVPDITGLYIEEAQMTLNASHLALEVIDSTYSTKTPLGTIVEQTPAAGSKTKNRRVVYAIQNARFRRPVVMPELRDVSLRQAQATLHTLGIEVESIDYEPSTYKDIVLDVRRNEIPVQAGERIAEGSKVVLVVGRGQGTAEVEVPALNGKTLAEARSWLLGSLLTVGTVEYDVEPTEENKEQYVVYSQSPTSGTIVVEGTNVNLKLSTDIEKTVIVDNEGDEEDFF